MWLAQEVYYFVTDWVLALSPLCACSGFLGDFPGAFS